MLTIRFNRVGKKNRAHFRIVLQEHTIAPGGKHIEILGSWDPHQKKGVFKNERINFWLGKGAQVSDSVHNLLIKQGIIKDKKRPVKIYKKKSKGEEAKEVKKTEKSETEETKEAKKPEVKEIKKTEEKKEESAKEKVEEPKSEKTEEQDKK